VFLGSIKTLKVVLQFPKTSEQDLPLGEVIMVALLTVKEALSGETTDKYLQVIRNQIWYSIDESMVSGWFLEGNFGRDHTCW